MSTRPNGEDFAFWSDLHEAADALAVACKAHGLEPKALVVSQVPLFSGGTSPYVAWALGYGKLPLIENPQEVTT